MPDNRFDGKPVSRDWDSTLTHARRMGVRFHLNSGRRTMREQWALWRARQRDPAHNPVAAWPSPLAPHIRVGRQAHAIDVQTGGEDRLQAWLRGQGLDARNTVRGEAWHLEVPERQLRRYAKRVRARQKKAGH